MNELQLFKNEEFGQIRTIVINGEPWMVGTDVATALGYSNPRKALGDHVDEEDRGVTKCDTLGGYQDMTVINESGLYSLILGSRLPSAKRFKRWVTSEVLPSIRKTGGYRLPQTFSEALRELADTTEALEQARTENRQLTQSNETLSLENNQLFEENERNRPMVEFTKAISGSRDSIHIGQFAKLIGVGPNMMFDWLRNNGYLGKTGSNHNMPIQKYIKMGVFTLKENTTKDREGNMIIYPPTPLVTGKGQVYLYQKYHQTQLWQQATMF